MRFTPFLLALIIWSCSGSKWVQESNKETTSIEKTDVKKDSVNTTIVSKPINDALTIPVVKSNTNNKAKDSVINAKVDEILLKLNTTKTSGNNSYKLYYDIDKRLVELRTLIGETKNTNVKTNSEQTTEKTLEEKTDEYISKKIKSIPFWVWLLVGFWFLPQILERVKLVVSPFSKFLK